MSYYNYRGYPAATNDIISTTLQSWSCSPQADYINALLVGSGVLTLSTYPGAFGKHKGNPWGYALIGLGAIGFAGKYIMKVCG